MSTLLDKRTDEKLEAKQNGKTHAHSYKGDFRNKRIKADWSSVDPVDLSAFIVACTNRGAAVLLGRTRDAGAFSIIVYANGEPHKDYVSASEDVGAFLRGYTEEVKSEFSGDGNDEGFLF